MGVIYAGILPGFAAIAVPVLIHFIRRRKYQRADLGTLRFLRVAIRERRRWRRIENWPLLLARIAIVSLITLLFARPFFAQREKIAPGELEVVLLVQASGSVSGPAFEAVRKKAGETLAKIPPGAKVTVAAFAEKVELLQGTGLDSLRAVPGARVDYSRLVDWTVDHLEQSERKFAQVYLIGDLQSATLPSAPPRFWPPKASASVVPVEPAGKWNLGISAIELLTPYATDEAEFEVSVAASGEVPKKDREVLFKLDDQAVQTQKIGAAGGRLRFRSKVAGTSVFRGAVSIVSEDKFPADNARPFAAPLTPPRRVLLVEGGGSLTPFDGAAYFAEKALLVSGKEHGGSPFAPKVQGALRDFADAGAVAFCDIDGLPPANIAPLASYVQEGGAVAFFLGKNTRPDFFARIAASGLFPEKLSAVPVPLPRPVDSWDKAHPALARFEGGEHGDLRGILLRDAFEIEPGPDWSVLARVDNGHPMLLTRKLGKGRVLVFANPVTREWSELPRERIFLPLLKEWFAWLVRMDSERLVPKEIACGLGEPRPPAVYEKGASLEIVAPDPASIDITTSDETTVRRVLGLPGEKMAAPRAETAGLPVLREHRNELWPWIALALLFFLPLENRLADRRLTRHARASS